MDSNNNAKDDEPADTDTSANDQQTDKDQD